MPRDLDQAREAFAISDGASTDPTSPRPASTSGEGAFSPLGWDCTWIQDAVAATFAGNREKLTHKEGPPTLHCSATSNEFSSTETPW